MNEKLQKAEKSLLGLLLGNPDGLTMEEILKKSGNIGEAELRAAVWTLRAEGAVDFADGKLKATVAA